MLLTGDQHIVNIIGDNPIERFYFPLSPTVGLIFPSTKNKVIIDDYELINKMNNEILKSSARYVVKY